MQVNDYGNYDSALPPRTRKKKRKGEKCLFTHVTHIECIIHMKCGKKVKNCFY